MTFLGSLEQHAQAPLAEQYLEFLVKNETEVEKYHTKLALHYIEEIKLLAPKEKEYLKAEQRIAMYRKKLMAHLKSSKFYK